MDKWEKYSSSEMIVEKRENIQYCERQIAQYDEFLRVVKSPAVIEDEYAKLFIGEFKRLVNDIKGIYQVERESSRSIDDENIATQENREILNKLWINYDGLQGFAINVIRVYNKFLDRSLQLTPYLPFRLVLERLEYTDPMVEEKLSIVSKGTYENLQASGISMVEVIRGLNQQFDAYRNGKPIFDKNYVPEEV